MLFSFLQGVLQGVLHWHVESAELVGTGTSGTSGTRGTSGTSGTLYLALDHSPVPVQGFPPTERMNSFT